MYLASIYTYLLGALMNDALSVGVPGHAPGGVAAGHVETLHTMPHERDSFTQGLLYHGNALIESTGLYGKSEIRRVDPLSGKVIKRNKLDKKYFGEGIAVAGNIIYMLTWKEHELLLFDVDTLELIHKMEFKTASGPGWGLTFDGNHLIASDGSATLVFWEVPGVSDRATREFRRINVRKDDGSSQDQVNELEYADGFIYANIWYKDRIIKIDPNTGAIVQTLDMTQLWPRAKRPARVDCLNGIAYNKSSGEFLLTGKLWPQYYAVKLADDSPSEL